MRGHAFMQLGCCAERYEQWILSEPLAFLWQVIAITYASELLLAFGKICVLHTVQRHNATISQAQPLFVVSNQIAWFFVARASYKDDCVAWLYAATWRGHSQKSTVWSSNWQKAVFWHCMDTAW